MAQSEDFAFDVAVVGGAGHVGFPLAVAFASRGLRACIYDVNAAACESISGGAAPFMEPGAVPMLRAALDAGLLEVSTDPSVLSTSESVIVVVGTPVDEHLSPDPDAVPRAVGALLEHLVPRQLLVLRSTVYPGVTRRIEKLLADRGADVDLAFCPERIAQGKALSELFELPQIVGCRTEVVTRRAAKLFKILTPMIVELSPEEAELAKLFTNAWRYLKFATANQFFMMANDEGLDFSRIRLAMGEGYVRAGDVPGAGFAAGPCLFKDTMQLSAVAGNSFALGHAAMLVNEGLPGYLLSRLERRVDLSEAVVGVLGMAFKADNDDTRASLAYKLKRLLRFRTREVLTTDPFVAGDPDLLPMDEVLERADVLVIGAPHTAYRSIRTDKIVVDPWNLLGDGTLV